MVDLAGAQTWQLGNKFEFAWHGEIAESAPAQDIASLFQVNLGSLVTAMSFSPLDSSGLVRMVTANFRPY
jgi:hypothetical protein